MNDYTKGLVSIITPCYNGAHLIPRLLDSVLAQDYPTVEMFVVDDGSTDTTIEVVDGYAPRFEAHGYTLRCLHREHQGQSAALSLGLKEVKGEYLLWPDSDDYFTPPPRDFDVCGGVLRPLRRFCSRAQHSAIRGRAHGETAQLGCPDRFWRAAI